MDLFIFVGDRLKPCRIRLKKQEVFGFAVRWFIIPPGASLHPPVNDVGYGIGVVTFDDGVRELIFSCHFNESLNQSLHILTLIFEHLFWLCILLRTPMWSCREASIK